MEKILKLAKKFEEAVKRAAEFEGSESDTVVPPPPPSSSRMDEYTIEQLKSYKELEEATKEAPEIATVTIENLPFEDARMLLEAIDVYLHFKVLDSDLLEGEKQRIKKSLDNITLSVGATYNVPVSVD